METPMVNVNKEAPKLSIVKGNSKLGKGIWAFSTLPGNEEKLLRTAAGTLITDVPGTCSKHCEACFEHGCYAVNAARRYSKNVVPAWAENTLLLRSGDVWGQVDAFITKKNRKYAKTKNPEDRGVRTFRINVSGELRSEEDVRRWNEVAGKHPEVVFAVYTKNYEAIDAVMSEDEGIIRENFIINISQWHGSADAFLAKYPGKFNVFEYDDSAKTGAEAVAAPHCPAVTREGKHAKTADGSDITCDACGRCYRKGSGLTGVWAH